MNGPRVTGVRIPGDSTVRWVEGGADAGPGELCLVEADGVHALARVVVTATQLTASAVLPVAGSIAAGTHRDTSSEHAPLAAALAAARPLLEGYLDVELQITLAPLRAELRSPRPAETARLAHALASALRMPVVIRLPDGTVPNPPLPRLGAAHEHDGRRCTVTVVSVYHGYYVLSCEGEEVRLPLPGTGRQRQEAGG